MSNQMTTLINAAKALAQSASTSGADDMAFIKFTKFGAWVWGAEDEEAEDDAQWAIHPEGFQHGWIAWGDKAHQNDGEKLGGIMVPATSPLPLEQDLDPVEGSWSQQISMQMVCLSGIDKGVKVVYNANSLGGRKIYAKIVDAVVAKIMASEDGVSPVVLLANSSYKHKTYGKIFTPVMNIERWLTLDDLNCFSADDDAEAAGTDDAQLELIEETAEEALDDSAAEEEIKRVKAAQAKSKADAEAAIALKAEKAAIEADAEARLAKAKAKSVAEAKAKEEASTDAPETEAAPRTRKRRTRSTS